VATILYPTRAGDSAHHNQDRAIAMARERKASLLLLYVSNVRFLDHLAGPAKVYLVEAELDELGEFMLAMVKDRAEKAGVQAEMVIRHGEFRQALMELIAEREITAAILGRPTHDTAITTLDYISEVARSLAAESGLEVFIIHEGEIVEQYGGSTESTEE
jgi:nucleotide-binding universal stress UspA family protein